MATGMACLATTYAGAGGSGAREGEACCLRVSRWERDLSNVWIALPGPRLNYPENCLRSNILIGPCRYSGAPPGQAGQLDPRLRRQPSIELRPWPFAIRSVEASAAPVIGELSGLLPATAPNQNAIAISKLVPAPFVVTLRCGVTASTGCAI